MNNKFHELAKGLAQSATGRQTLKKLSIALTSFGLAAAASADDSGLNLFGMSGSPALPADGVFFNVIHSYSPADICAAYGVDALHNEGWTGKGQTIIVVDYYDSPTALQDLQTFSTTFGLSAPDLTIIYPNGQPTLNNDKLGDVGEVSLDLQWAHAIAPDAKLVLISANPTETDGVHGFPSIFKGIQLAISNYPGSAISQSFAGTEQAFSGAADVQLAKYEAIYQQALAAGCTPLASSGDWGTANFTKQGGGNGSTSASASFYSYPTVNWPASSPSVTAVGGTWLQYHWRWNPQIPFATYLTLAGWTVNPSTSENPLFEAFLNWDATSDRVEAVWHEDPLDIFNVYNATGGGLSAFFATPSWQSGLPSSLTQGARALPDLAWNAAGDGGVLIYCTPRGGWQFGAGGTSAATPQIAGLVAIVNQMRASMGKGPIGHLAPKLYQLPSSDFNDIVPVTFGSGANAFTVGDNTRYGGGVPGWPCTVGYDLDTGLGSPKAYSFVYDLATMFP